MRYNFDFSEPNNDERPKTLTSTSKDQVEWLPLQNHPVFTSGTGDDGSGHSSTRQMPRNLMAWDGASSRLYYWNPDKKFLHRISIRLGEPDPTSVLAASPSKNHPVFTSGTGDDGSGHSSTRQMPRNLMAWDGASSRLYYWNPDKKFLHRISIRLGEPDPTSVLAASPSKVLQADTNLSFLVNKISINRNGSALLLAGSEGLCVMYLYERSSMKDNIMICRTVSIGSDIYFTRNDVIRTLQISWHPYSDTHLGILSSDSVFRLFDLSTALGQPEQEYYLQPIEPGRLQNASSICPVDFSFGGDHLWDRFSVSLIASCVVS
ncbi:unnamed protein product [Ilex paraguariensis]|uniref:Uncharacterized protein n=1 Tax=Ilex paraguariensis TaxID=185542 RepID=A0ABC8QSS3_9AQUA